MATGAMIKLLRTAEGLPQKDLAEKLGVSRSYLCQIEKETREPSMDLLRRIADAFGMPVGLLVTDESDANPELSGKLQDIFSSFLAANIRSRDSRKKVGAV